MIRTRRLTALTVGILAALPAAASATVTCPAQPTLNAWAGSPKALQIAPCTTDQAGGVTYALDPLVTPTMGTASVPAADGTFTFTGTFNSSGSDPIGGDTVGLVASDGAPSSLTFTVPISIGAAPEVNTTFKAKDLAPDTTLEDGRPTFDIFYKTPVTATSLVIDPTPGTPLAAFNVRFRSGLGVATQAPTNAAGKVVTKFTPLVTDEYAFDVPSLPGSFVEGYVLWVAPDWKIARTFPVKNKKYVISGRLLAKKSARTRGSSIAFQRLKGKRWITVIRKVPISTSMTFSVKVSRSAFSGKTVRFFYTSKNVDYIGSSFRFTIKPKSKAHVAPRTITASSTAIGRALHH